MLIDIEGSNRLNMWGGRLTFNRNTTAKHYIDIIRRKLKAKRNHIYMTALLAVVMLSLTIERCLLSLSIVLVKR